MGHLFAEENIYRQSRQLGRIQDIPSLQMVMNMVAARAEEQGLQVYKRRVYTGPGEVQVNGFPFHYEFCGWLQVIDPRCVPLHVRVGEEMYEHCLHTSLELSIYDSGLVRAEYMPATASEQSPLEDLLP